MLDRRLRELGVALGTLRHHAAPRIEGPFVVGSEKAPGYQGPMSRILAPPVDQSFSSGLADRQEI